MGERTRWAGSSNVYNFWLPSLRRWKLRVRERSPTWVFPTGDGNESYSEMRLIAKQDVFFSSVMLSSNIGFCSELILCFMLEFVLKPGIVTVVVNAS